VKWSEVKWSESVMFLSVTFYCRHLINIVDMSFGYTSRCVCFNLLNAELNPICHLLALLVAHHILHISRIRVCTVVVLYWFVKCGWVWLCVCVGGWACVCVCACMCVCVNSIMTKVLLNLCADYVMTEVFLNLTDVLHPWLRVFRAFSSVVR
jgi:hypothetical protein